MNSPHHHRAHGASLDSGDAVLAGDLMPMIVLGHFDRHHRLAEGSQLLGFSTAAPRGFGAAGR
ncbi:hypothetical protein [Ralstonia solanacearum]|uniref:hypothetical protein n=1 Tax=Ralstonia solanacearum TaxID=305 RepID=UPI0001D967CC|nr:hypothetical protein [Ralstonia solanacearum]CBM10532.1 protein of unknown function [Ralstonia solanacearum PSI07]